MELGFRRKNLSLYKGSKSRQVAGPGHCAGSFVFPVLFRVVSSRLNAFEACSRATASGSAPDVVSAGPGVRPFISRLLLHLRLFSLSSVKLLGLHGSDVDSGTRHCRVILNQRSVVTLLKKLWELSACDALARLHTARRAVSASASASSPPSCLEDIVMKDYTSQAVFDNLIQECQLRILPTSLKHDVASRMVHHMEY
jgi:hypothetical protein